MDKRRLLVGPSGIIVFGILACALLGTLGCDMEGSDEDPDPERVLSIYWNYSDKILKTDVYEYWGGILSPTSKFDVVIEEADMDTWDVQVDPVNEKLYWTQRQVSTGHYQVWRADLDGANPELLVDGLGLAHQLVLDVDEGKVYWCGEEWLPTGTGTRKAGLIQRANLDGSDFEPTFIETSTRCPADLALKLDDPKALYWCVWDDDDDRYEIRKAALDPLSAEEEVVTSNSMLTGGMAYHDGYLYWGAQLWNRIYKLPEGGGNADVVEVLVAPDVQDIAIDAVGGRMYWGNYDIIYCLNLDGTGNPYGSVFGLTSTGTEVRGLALLRLK